MHSWPSEDVYKTLRCAYANRQMMFTWELYYDVVDVAPITNKLVTDSYASAVMSLGK